MVNIAICGAGRAGSFLHFNVYKKLKCNIVALVETNTELAKIKKNELGIKQSFNNVDELISSGANIDIVSVCSSLDSHYDITKKSLEAGFNVLLEKPATKIDKELDELYEIASKLKLKLAVVHNHKFYPSFVELMELTKSNDLGRIVHIDRVMSFDRKLVRMMEPEHWSHNLPGGRLFEANTHNIYLLHSLIGNFELLNIEPITKPNYFPHASISGFTSLFRGKSCTVNLTVHMNCDSQVYGNHAATHFIVCYEKGAGYCDKREIKVLKTDLKTNIKHSVNKILENIQDKFTKTETIGKGSGHYWFIKRFIDSVIDKRLDSPVLHSEAIFTQSMNSEMGKKIDLIIKD